MVHSTKKYIALFFFSILSFSAKGTDLSVTTFNTGLAHGFVADADKRVKLIVNELKKHDTDILCLQEVWRENDQNSLKKGLQEAFPFSFSSPIVSEAAGEAPVCHFSDLFAKNRPVRCLAEKCRQAKDLTGCLLDQCASEIQALKKENPLCLNALFSQVGENPAIAILKVLSPFSAPSRYAYEGSDGLMLFSKLPLEEVEAEDFSAPTTINRRRYIDATLKKDGRDFRILCTHLTADLGTRIPYVGKFSNWAEENYEQVKELVGVIENSTVPSVLAGDFNCSLAEESKKIQDSFPASCQYLQQAHSLKNVYWEAKGSCTFCADNSLNEGSKENTILDHVFFRDFTSDKTERVFDQPQNGQFLSDHFGIKTHLRY
jgi:endonuclease/exonuclease/phosphatase family metal-dependent hydrolase